MDLIDSIVWLSHTNLSPRRIQPRSRRIRYLSLDLNRVRVFPIVGFRREPRAECNGTVPPIRPFLLLSGAPQAIGVVFRLSPKPEALAAAVVRRMATDTLASDEASPLALARLCFVLGHVGLKLLVYSEVCVCARKMETETETERQGMSRSSGALRLDMYPKVEHAKWTSHDVA